MECALPIVYFQSPFSRNWIPNPLSNVRKPEMSGPVIFLPDIFNIMLLIAIYNWKGKDRRVPLNARVYKKVMRLSLTILPERAGLLCLRQAHVKRIEFIFIWPNFLFLYRQIEFSWFVFVPLVPYVWNVERTYDQAEPDQNFFLSVVADLPPSHF